MYKWLGTVAIDLFFNFWTIGEVANKTFEFAMKSFAWGARRLLETISFANEWKCKRFNNQLSDFHHHVKLV